MCCLLWVGVFCVVLKVVFSVYVVCVFTHKSCISFTVKCTKLLCELWHKLFAKAVVSVSLVQVRTLYKVCKQPWVTLFIPSQGCWDISVCCCRLQSENSHPHIYLMHINLYKNENWKDLYYVIFFPPTYFYFGQSPFEGTDRKNCIKCRFSFAFTYHRLFLEFFGDVYLQRLM